ncbi:flagellar basal-body MS-ring/collar protein FliF [Novosphingopyxis sp. YJ-S2-01]|uniref:flagellar basal-body MS-ring/collar protein FliF n=1 Tax=Novosphingopyxis sp. YJ-S2-01 TaxID=2794021 RepID=UPI0018DC8C5F|nr:flagellar basal-body MS-ring/collar protein FliF [Novosphingopyxis sp. YJ-S2-01]MBH9538589.1 flagellar M-ring protein FliF [Novosphingopyxis sp. YJ-S2-01]
MNDMTISQPIDGNAGGAAARPTQRLKPIGFSSSSNGGMGGGFMDRARDFLSQPAVAKSLPLLGFIAVAAMAAAAWLALQSPPQRDLFRGLPESDKAAVAQALDSNSIPYQLDNSTGALTVSEDDYYAAKMLLAAQGLPKSAPDGDSMISSMPMGASRAVETEKLRAAREADLARSIEAIDTVVTARVHLAVDPPSVFIRERNEPAASVVLNLQPGTTLGNEQVQAITHLVASSVSGLNADRVSVVDQNGRLLSETAENGPLGETGKQLAVQEQVEDRYRRSLTALLTPILGANNFAAEVSADLDFSERQATSETFPKDESVVRSEQRSWTAETDGANGTPGGIPGALSDQPPENGTAQDQMGDPAVPADMQKRQEQVNRNYELGRQIAVTKDASGVVSRVSVAVAIANGPDGKPRSPAEIAAIEKLVKGAIGFNAQRGDQVEISSRAFQPIVTEETPWYEASWVSLLVRNVSGLLVALALIFFIGRPLLKRRKELKNAPALPAAEASEAPALARSADEARKDEPVTLDMITAAHSYQERALLIQNFVKQNPEHATLVVRDLLKSAKAPKEAVNG